MSWTFGTWMGIILVGIAPGEISLSSARTPAELESLFEQATLLFNEAQQRLADDPDQARRGFRAAAQQFESIVANGVTNGQLEYNLGNCHLQAGNVGQAMLHYRRAERMMPRDPLLADNIEVAKSRCLTHIASSRKSAFLRTLFVWHYQATDTGRVRAALIFYFVFWFLLTLRLLIRKRMVSVFAVISALIAASAIGSVALTRWVDRSSPAGVVTAMDVAVYKGDSTGYQRQFEEPLQPGVEFIRRKKTAGGWWNIELPDGTTGWIESSQAELVPDLSS